MSSITISNLDSAGSDLLFDSESYLKELSEDDLSIQGGIWNMVMSGSMITIASGFAGVGLGFAAGYAYTKYKTTI
jgi:hypothetical protein